MGKHTFWKWAAVLVILAGCGKPAKRIDVVLVNSTGYTLTIKARAGFFGRSVKLAPGMVWKGWIPAGVAPKEIRVEVKP